MSHRMRDRVKAIQAGDWVSCKAVPDIVGNVVRVARDGSWADVNWHTHSKRMRIGALKVEHTIAFVGGTVTDVGRKEELESLEGTPI